MKFQNVIGSLALLTGLFVSAPGAEAFTNDQCQSHRDGSVLCLDMISRSGSFNVWEVGYTHGSTSEVFDITCRGKSLYDWSSYGNMSQREADNFASRFCAL